MSPPTLYLVRHGRARAGFDEAHDPGLDAVGRDQAAAVAARLDAVGPLPVVSSPLLRARQTAAAFETLWRVQARVEPAVAEIPSPAPIAADLQARAAWLRGAMRGTWSELPAEYAEWRDRLVAALVNIETSSVVTTHFIAINAAVGAATDDDRIVCFAPDNCSCTRLGVEDGRLVLRELGHERPTQVG